METIIMWYKRIFDKRIFGKEMARVIRMNALRHFSNPEAAAQAANFHVSLLKSVHGYKDQLRQEVQAEITEIASSTANQDTIEALNNNKIKELKSVENFFDA